MAKEPVFINLERFYRNLGIENRNNDSEMVFVRQVITAAEGSKESGVRRKLRGFWEASYGRFACSNCKTEQDAADEYCRKCGAEMLTIAGDIACIKKQRSKNEREKQE